MANISCNLNIISVVCFNISIMVGSYNNSFTTQSGALIYCLFPIFLSDTDYFLSNYYLFSSSVIYIFFLTGYLTTVLQNVLWVLQDAL